VLIAHAANQIARTSMSQDDFAQALSRELHLSCPDKAAAKEVPDFAALTDVSEFVKATGRWLKRVQCWFSGDQDMPSWLEESWVNALEPEFRQAREDNKQVNWHVSVGFDVNRRIQAVTRAVQMQRIPQERGQKYLADLSVTPVTEDGRAVVALLTGDVSRPSPKLRARLAVVTDSMLAMQKANAEEKTEMRIQAANELADRRALLVQQAEQLEARRAAQ